LLAVTVNVYGVPFVKPLTVVGLDVLVPVMLEGLEVAVKSVYGVHSALAIVKPTVALALPAVAVPIVGAAGTVAVVIALEAAEAPLVPSAFVAVTVNV
jgi:hypothetical protein